jgi:lysophosphatidate acyltransferase
MDAGNLPLVPIVISNSSHVFHIPERHFNSGTIRVKVLNPVITAIRDGETKEEAMLRILEEVKEKTLAALRQISSV